MASSADGSPQRNLLAFAPPPVLPSLLPDHRQANDCSGEMLSVDAFLPLLSRQGHELLAVQ